MLCVWLSEATVIRLDAATPEAFRKLEDFDPLNRKNINRAILEFQLQ